MKREEVHSYLYDHAYRLLLSSVVVIVPLILLEAIRFHWIQTGVTTLALICTVVCSFDLITAIIAIFAGVSTWAWLIQRHFGRALSFCEWVHVIWTDAEYTGRRIRKRAGIPTYWLVMEITMGILAVILLIWFLASISELVRYPRGRKAKLEEMKERGLVTQSSSPVRARREVQQIIVYPSAQPCPGYVPQTLPPFNNPYASRTAAPLQKEFKLHTQDGIYSATNQESPQITF